MKIKSVVESLSCHQKNLRRPDPVAEMSLGRKAHDEGCGAAASGLVGNRVRRDGRLARPLARPNDMGQTIPPDPARRYGFATGAAGAAPACRSIAAANSSGLRAMKRRSASWNSASLSAVGQAKPRDFVTSARIAVS